jgi:nucleoside-diphosphate-sugar epimerase
MPPRLLITGASGYIGARLVRLALQAGFEVAVLGSPSPGGPALDDPWRLGDEPPPETLAGVSALLHLGHSWTGDGAGEANVNLVGAERLARAALSAGIEHFVFASTTSARAEALNNYGRVKHAIEQRLLALPGAAGRVIIARIGLVYGGPERGQYGLMSKLVDLTPVLPMIGLDRRVQPIHLDEVCEALLRLACDPQQDRQIVVVAGPEPVTFAAWLRILRRARTGKGLILLPVPIGAALLACDLTRLVPFVPTIDRERVLGLAGAAPMASAADLAALGIAPVDPAVKLAGGKAARRRALAEAVAMLRYVAGDPIRAAGPIIRLARALERDPGPRRALPAFVLRWPSLMRLLEPWRPSTQHGLSRRLHLAAMVAEALPPEAQVKGRSLAGAVVQLALEALVFPIRLLCGRLYA